MAGQAPRRTAAAAPPETPRRCTCASCYAWGDSHALSAAFAPLSGGRANGEEGVIEALRSSLREMEAELGPDDANVLEIRKMLREYEEAQRR